MHRSNGRNHHKRHRKHYCRSAPATPANVSLAFKRREAHHRHEWVGHVKFDSVTVDTAGRPLTVEAYEVELKAVDASGDEVETHLQAVDSHNPGSDFTVATGTVPTVGRAREFDGSGSEEVRLTLSGLTAGIAHQVEFYARKSTSGSDRRVTVAIRDTTSNTVVATKNAPAPDSQNKSHVIGTLSFTPVAGHGYRAEVTYFGGSTGTLLFDGINRHDKGDTAVWRTLVQADDDNRAAFVLARPDAWFYTARVRTLNRIHGGKCWSAWSGWTTPGLPTDDDAMIGPPDVTGLALAFKRDAPTNNPWRGRATWNEVPHFITPNGESHVGAASYDLVLETAATNGGTVMHTRRAKVGADPTATTNEYSFNNLKRSRWYRVKIRPVDALGNPGAWSSFTSWAQPGGSVPQPNNITTHNPEPRVIVIRWDPPNDETDVDRYHWKVVRGAGDGTLVDEGYVGKGTHKVEWHIPAAEYAAHKHATYRGRVRAEEAPYSTEVDDVGTIGWTTPAASTEIESVDVTDSVTLDPTVVPAVTSDGAAPASSPAVTLAVPNLPRTIVVQWPEITNADDVTYDVYRHTASFTPPGTGTLVFSGQATRFVDTQLVGGTTYFYRVIARDVDGSAAPGTQASATAKSFSSDGSAPGSSPTPIMRGGVGYLYIEWDAVTNVDPVTYEVHLSTTSGFTPSAGTLAAEIRGTFTFLKAMPDGSSLRYFQADGATPQTYYVKLKAKDDDGTAAASAQASATLVQATGDDIAVGSLTAEHILAGSLSTQYLGAVDSLISNLIAGDPDSQHVEVDADGLRVMIGSGDTAITLVELPTDPTKRPTFNGDLIAQNLEVIGASILGDTFVKKDTTVSLESVVGPPGNAPSATISYPTTAATFKESGVVQQKSWFNLAYSATGGAAGNVPSFYTSRPSAGGYWRYIEEHRVSDGELTRTITLEDNSDDCWGLAIIGSNLYVLFKRWDTGAFFIRKYAMSDFTTWTATSVRLDQGGSGNGYIHSARPGLGTDGTNLYVVSGATATSPSDLRIGTIDTSLNMVTVVTHNALTVDTREDGGGSSGARSTEFGGLIKVGSTWYLAAYSYDGSNITRRGVFAFTGTITTANGLTRNTDEDFNGALGAEVDGIAHDGTSFYSILDGGTLTKHTNWTWTSVDSPVYWVGYTWYDSVGTTHETTVSPRRQLTMRKRAGLSVTMSPLFPGSGGVDDPNNRRVYINRGAVEPTVSGRFDGKRQATVTTASTLLTSFATGGAANPSSNNFPGTGAPAEIVDASATGMKMAGGGTLVLPKFARLARPSSPVIGQTFIDDPTGQPLLWDGAAWVPLSAVGRHMAASWQIDADDLMPAATATALSGAFTAASTGTGANASNVPSVPSHPGIWKLDTGTTSSGRTVIATGLGSVLLGSGRVRMGTWLYLPTLSDPTDRARFYFGLVDSLSESTMVDGVYFRYADNLNSGKWGGRVVNDGVAATLVSDPGPAVTVATWYFLEIEVNDDASLATFYINGSSIGTATGLPSGAGDEMRLEVGVEKVLGTTARTLWVDEVFAFGEMTTAR